MKVKRVPDLSPSAFNTVQLTSKSCYSSEYHFVCYAVVPTPVRYPDALAYNGRTFQKEGLRRAREADRAPFLKEEVQSLEGFDPLVMRYVEIETVEIPYGYAFKTIHVKLVNEDAVDESTQLVTEGNDCD